MREMFTSFVLQYPILLFHLYQRMLVYLLLILLHPLFPSLFYGLDATDSSANSGIWLDKSSQGNNAVKHGSPSADGNKWNNLYRLPEYSGSMEIIMEARN